MRSRLLSFLPAVFSLALPLSAQYKMDAAGDPLPPEVPAAIASAMQAPGVKILSPAGEVFCEVWMMKTTPQGGSSTESDVTLPTIPIGSLLGAVKFPAKGTDRRGQVIPAGIYLLRYVLMPVNGAHLGAAPQRDFAAMVPAASDKGPSSKVTVDQVVAMSIKVSGTSHPAVLSLAPGSGKTGFTKEGDHDWTLNTKIGDLPVAIILVGKAEG
ncbi:MAG: hypothetical protein M3Z09_04955 [Acidobacteriota bacterium]|nr:hypothetical protein [Acidobacteriota bacterium]